MPIPQEHGDIASLGFRFGDLAYSPDISGIPEASLPLLQGSMCGSSTRCGRCRIRATSASSRRCTGSSACGAKRAILTHMTADLDYEALRRELPAHVEPAYDGMVRVDTRLKAQWRDG